MPIAPKDLYLALQKELMLECGYLDQRISIFPRMRIRKWKYINRWYLTVVLAIIAALALLLPSVLKVGLKLEGISYITATISIISTLIILLLGLQSETLSFDLDASTRYQIKQLFGK